MDVLNKIFLITSPIAILIGTLLIMYSEKKKIKTDPHYALNKFASNLTKEVPMDSIIAHEKLYFPHNRKMKFLLRMGITLLIVGTGLAVIALI
jgi:putative N-acetylmannosamine-6-phosphate epimerase